MIYKLYDEPFVLNKSTFMNLYNDAMTDMMEVIDLYTDVICEDPLTGLNLAITDFLSNDSPLMSDGEYLSYDEMLKLGKELFETNILDGKKCRYPFDSIEIPAKAQRVTAAI